MANILQAGKRGRDLPRLIDGPVFAAQQYHQHTAEEKAAQRYPVPPLLYCARVSAPFVKSGDHQEEFTLQLTEEEMIALTSEWLTMMNRRRIDARNEARRKAEREACLSKTSLSS